MNCILVFLIKNIVFLLLLEELNSLKVKVLSSYDLFHNVDKSSQTENNPLNSLNFKETKKKEKRKKKHHLE